MKNRRLSLLVALVMILSLLSGYALAEAPVIKNDGTARLPSGYPDKNIELLISYAPGGGSDILCRALLKYVNLPVEVVIVSMEGAGGLTGAMDALNRKPDGYTIVNHNPASLIDFYVNSLTDKKIWQELDPVATVAMDYTVLYTTPKTGVKTFEEAMQYFKDHPKTQVCTAGLTGNGPLFAEKLVADFDPGWILTPYDGSAAANAAMLGGHADFEFASTADGKAMVDAGEFIPLIVVGEERAAHLPDVPCTKELGIDFTAGHPRGFYCVPGTDPEIRNYWTTIIGEISAMPEFQQDMMDLGLVPYYRNSEEMKAQTEIWYEQISSIHEMIAQK